MPESENCRRCIALLQALASLIAVVAVTIHLRQLVGYESRWVTNTFALLGIAIGLQVTIVIQRWRNLHCR